MVEILLVLGLVLLVVGFVGLMGLALLLTVDWQLNWQLMDFAPALAWLVLLTGYFSLLLGGFR